MQDQQQQQKIILTQEIRLLEKKKLELLQEVSRIEASTKEAYTQNTKKIKELTTRHTSLLEQTEILREGMDTLTIAYTTAKADMEVYTQECLAAMKQEVDSAHIRATALQSNALDEKKKAEVLLEQADKKEQGIRTRENELLASIAAYRSQKAEFELAKVTEAEIMQKAAEALALIQKQKAVIEGEVEKLSQEKDLLMKKIQNETSRMENERQHIEEGRGEIARGKKANQQHKEMLDAKEIDLSKEKEAIADRRATLERAVDEMRSKGAVI